MGTALLMLDNAPSRLSPMPAKIVRMESLRGLLSPMQSKYTAARRDPAEIEYHAEMSHYRQIQWLDAPSVCLS